MNAAEAIAPGRPRIYRLVPWLVRATVPGERPGSYMLFAAGQAIYAGRSDTDLRRRLLHHARNRRGDYFDFDANARPHAAFVVECANYHAVDDLQNRIHPAAPAASNERCPFCRTAALATLTDRLGSAIVVKETGSARPITI
jgi:hypothetical protein